MFNVLIVIGASCFCRIDELITIKLEHINVRMSNFRDDGTLNALCIQVKGKKDEFQYLYMYANRSNQLLCPINNFLWWISLTKIKSGFLIPLKSNLTKGFAKNFVFKKHMGYKTMLDLVKKKFSAIQPNFDYGTHSIRRTAFLLALWYGATDSDLMNTARAQQNTIARYRGDSTTRKALAKLDGNIGDHLFPIYLSQYIEMNRILGDFVGKERDDILHLWINRWTNPVEILVSAIREKRHLPADSVFGKFQTI
jgi:hypothetical protein